MFLLSSSYYSFLKYILIIQITTQQLVRFRNLSLKSDVGLFDKKNKLLLLLFMG